MAMRTVTQLIGGPLDGDNIDLDEILEVVPGSVLDDFEWVDLFWVEAHVYIRYTVRPWRGYLALMYDGISPQ